MSFSSFCVFVLSCGTFASWFEVYYIINLNNVNSRKRHSPTSDRLLICCWSFVASCDFRMPSPWLPCKSPLLRRRGGHHYHTSGALTGPDPAQILAAALTIFTAVRRQLVNILRPPLLQPHHPPPPHPHLSSSHFPLTVNTFDPNRLGRIHSR